MIPACDADSLRDNSHGLIGERSIRRPLDNLDVGIGSSLAFFVGRAEARDPRFATGGYVDAALRALVGGK